MGSTVLHYLATSMANATNVHIRSLGDVRRCRETWFHTFVVGQKRVVNCGRILAGETEQEHIPYSQAFR
jgi:hypothetical protein